MSPVVRRFLLAAVLLAPWPILSLTGCAPRAVAPAPRPAENVLRWQAQNEKGVYGYLVFRAEQPEGPFLRISRQIVHVPPDAPEIGSYRFIDRDVEPGRTYYYTLDMVRSTGQKIRFSDVISKTVPR